MKAIPSAKRTTVIINRVNKRTGTIYSCKARLRNLIKIGTGWFWIQRHKVPNFSISMVRAYMTDGVYVATVKI